VVGLLFEIAKPQICGFGSSAAVVGLLVFRTERRIER